MQTDYFKEYIYEIFQKKPVGIPLSGGTTMAKKWEAFPKEAIIDFNINLATLALKITEVLNEVKNIKSSFATTIGDLNNTKYSLNCPIPVIVTKENDEFFCECVDFNIFGIGISEKCAIEDIKKVVVKYYESLTNPKEKLSKRLKSKLKLLKKHILHHEE